MRSKVHPLVAQGTKVFIPYSNERAFGSTRRYSGGAPTQEFLNWMAETAGPRDVLWHATKASDHTGLNIYFYVRTHAVMAKLTWG